MSHNAYHHIVAEDRANRRLLYVLIFILFCLVLLIWVITWSFDKSNSQLKFNDISISQDEVTGRNNRSEPLIAAVPFHAKRNGFFVYTRQYLAEENYYVFYSPHQFI